MCSVVGYVGKQLSREIVLEGLSRLEYRGYDSAGFSCLDADNNQLVYAKSAGQLINLQKIFEHTPINGHIGIGHTRWSTHGVASEANAHPQFDCLKKISIVHNGIIENYHELKAELIALGHTLRSETDTEVIAHLFELYCATSETINHALVRLVERLNGAYACILLQEDQPDTMILVRKRSPLCIGIGDGEMFAASDPVAFIGKTDQVIYLPESSFALVRKDLVELFDFKGNPLSVTIQACATQWVNFTKDGHSHFMLKEIYEQKGAIYATLQALKALDDTIWEQLGLNQERARAIKSLQLIGCGTSWHAARLGQFFFEEVAQVPTSVSLASEFRYMKFFPKSDSLYIALSQSGETADTLEVIRMLNELSLPTATITNNSLSTMAREAGGFLLTQAGHEVAVASTKSFSTQLVVLYWLAHRLAAKQGHISEQEMSRVESDILIAAEVLENTIEDYKSEIITTLAQKYAHYDKAIFLGRHISYPFALESALKLKEISYIFAQCYPAGELKHGPLALIDEKTPIFIFSHQDPVIYQKIVANAQEAYARKGHIIVFAFEGQHELIALAQCVFVIPRVKPLLGPLAMTGLMQFFFYEIAKELGRPIDKPRNLAKSVTVE